MDLDARKTCLRGFANNKGADQPAHPRSQISAFVIRVLERIIFKLATGEELLAIRRIFSLVDMITNTKFSNCPNVFKNFVVWQ